mgnify:FL=1
MVAKLRQAGVLTLAALLMLAGVLAIGGRASSAQAADPDSEKSVVNTSYQGNIHLTKYDDSKGSTAPTGTPTEVGANPVEGITFKLSKVTKDADGKAIDLTTNEGLKAAAKLQAKDIKADPAKYGVEEVKTEKTDANGKIDWNDLDLGVYLLQETDSHGKVNGKAQTFNAAAPSLVFLPTTDPTNNDKWIEDGAGHYGVWVYPKNSVNSNEKVVEDKGKQVGDKITYKVTSSIPAVAKDKDGNYNLKDFAFYDQLDPKLSLNAKDVTVKVGKEKLVPGTDYQVEVYDGKDGKGQFLYVYIDKSGRDKIAAAKVAVGEDQVDQVELSFSPTVKESGLIANQAQVFKNTGEGKGETEPPTPDKPNVPKGSEDTNIVVSGWGTVNITKTDEDGTPLPGATFKLCKDDGNDTTKCTGIKVNGRDTWTSDNEGKIVIDGIHVGDYVDDSALDQSVKYKLVETEAPKGYELIHQPIPFEVKVNNIKKIKTKTVDGKEVDRTVEEISTKPGEADKTFGTNLVFGKDVVNIKVKPKLPLTGGKGVLTFGLIGLAVIAGGLTITARRSKNEA